MSLIRIICGVVVTFAGLATSIEASEWKLVGPPGGELREIEIVDRTLWVADHSRLHVREEGGNWKTLTVEAEGSALNGVTDMKVDPTNPDRVGVSGASSALFTIDGGKSWKDATHSASFNAALHGKIEWHPRGDAVYLAMGGCTIDYVHPAGLYRSTGTLDEWALVLFGCMEDLTIDPTDPDVIYLAQRFYWNRVSRDGGETWSERDEPHPFDIVVDPVNPGVKYATGGETEVMFTVNDGLDWTPLPHRLDGPAPEIRLAFTPHGTLLAVVPDANLPATVYELDNGWNEVEVPFARATDIAMEAQTGEIYVTGSLGLVKTASWPPEWEAVGLGYASRPVISLAAHPGRAGTVVTSVRVEHDRSEGYVFQSESLGKEWDLLLLPGLPLPAPYEVAIDDQGTVFATGPLDASSIRLYRLKDGEESWTVLPLTHIQRLETSGGRVFAILGDRIVPLGPGSPIPVPERARDFAVAKSSGKEILLAIGTTLLGSTTGGASWTPIEEHLNPRYFESAPSDPSVVYLIADSPRDETGNREISFFRSLDGGASWEEGGGLERGEFAASGLGHAREFMAIHPRDPKIVCVATTPDHSSGGAWAHCSRDAGSTWQAFGDGLGALPGWLTFDATGDWLYAAAGNGVLRIRFADQRRRAVRRH